MACIKHLEHNDDHNDDHNFHYQLFAVQITYVSCNTRPAPICHKNPTCNGLFSVVGHIHVMVNSQMRARNKNILSTKTEKKNKSLIDSRLI